MGQLADAFVRVRPDVSGVAGPVTRQLSTAGAAAGASFSSKFKESMKKLAVGLGLTFAAVKILSVIKDTFKEAVSAQREQQALNRITANVIKTTGDASKVTLGHVQALAAGLSIQTGVTKDLIQGGENLLLTQTHVRNEQGKGNDIFDRATKISLDLSKAMGTTMSGASIKVGKALQDPVHGLTALARVGITFTDQQKKQIKTMVDSGNILGAQKLILAELEKRYKGTAAAAATPAEKMHAAWHELLVTIGAKITPVMDKLANLFTTKIFPAIISILNGTSAWNEKIKSTVTWVRALLNNCRPLAAIIYTIVAATAAYILISAGLGAVSKAIKLSKDAWQALNNTIKANWIILTISLIVGALIYAYTHFKSFRDFVKSAWAEIQVAFSFAWNNIIRPVMGAIGAAFRALLPSLQALWTQGFQPLFSEIGGIFAKLYNSAIKPYGAQIQFVIRAIAAVTIWWVQNVTIPFIRFYVATITVAIKVVIAIIQGLIVVIRAIVAATTWWIVNVTVPTFKILIAAITFAINSIIIPTIRALGAAFTWIVNAVINLKNWFIIAWNAILNAVKVAYSGLVAVWATMVSWINVIAATSRNLWATIHTVWSEIIGYIAAAWNGTIKVIWGLIQGSMHVLMATSNQLWTTIHNVWALITSWVAAAWNGTIKGIWGLIQGSMHVLMTTSNQLWTVFHNVWALITQWVAAAWNGTIKPTWAAIIGGAKNLVNWLNWMRDRFGAAFNTIDGWAVSFKNKLVTTFTQAKNGIITVWNQIKAGLAAPVNWVISLVYTNGIKKMWDGVAGLVGLGKMPTVGTLKFSSGGMVPGRDIAGRDDVLARLTKGEGVLSVPEMDAIGGPSGFNALRAAISGRYDGGGIIGNILGGIGGAVKGFFGGAKDILQSVAGGALHGLAKPIEAIIDKLPGKGGWFDALRKIPKTLIDAAINKLTGAAQTTEAAANFGFGGSGVDGVLKFLQGIKGRIPYVLGGVGPRSYDCSGLVGEVWARLTGHPSFRRYFVTGGETSFLTKHGFVRGLDPGGFSVGHNGEHTTGMLAGHQFEAAHTGTLMRFDTPGETNIKSFPNIFHLPRTAFGSGAGIVGGTLGAWINKALSIMHLPQSWAGPMATLIRRESGGNPRAVNRVDSNARAGNPSEGLTQTTIGTFARYHDASLGNNIFDPVQNIVASLQYIIARYGSIFKVQQANDKLPPHGYRMGGIIQQLASMDKGGYLVPGWNMIHNGLGRLEPVGTAIGSGGNHTWNVSLAVQNLQEIRDVEDFLNRMRQTSRAKGH